MRAVRKKSKRAIKRGERHGYFTEGKMRKEHDLAKSHEKEMKAFIL